MRKLKILVVLVLFFFFLTQSHTTLVLAQENNEASDNFKTSIDSTYTVNLDGITKVSHHIKITNKTPAFYLKQYALKTSYFGLNDIVIKNDEKKEIPANIVSNNLGTSIGITFQDEIVGQGKSRDFYIEYNNQDLATIAGKILEIHIPQFGDSSSFNENKTTLITPTYFSIPVRVKPEPKSVKFKEDQVISIFERPSGDTISALYGQEQIYKMTLRYSLENPTSSTALAQISLPPDTPFQKMHYHALDPLPIEMKKDPDGNWIATYRIPANTANIIHLTAEAKLTLEPNNNVPYTTPTQAHTKSLKYWESNDQSILEKAQSNKTPEQIYDFIIDSLDYSRAELTLENISRLGAVKAFEKPNEAVCQEFTDTFIALARANNIPARRLVGYAYTENSVLRPLSFNGDILHSWPEYYNYENNSWTQIDPTWGDTTGGIDYFSQFDLNHIVFAINGVSSSLPHPAGSYKINNQDTKDIDVTIGDIFPNINPQISTRMTQKKFLFIPIPGMYEMSITNDTGQAWYDIEANITSLDPEIRVSFTESSELKTLLPFQTIKLNITFFTKGISSPKDSSININYKNITTNKLLYESSTQSIQSGPETINQLQDTQTLIYLGSGAVIFALITGSLLVLRQKWSSSLRRKSKEAQEQS